ncbi:hypothetical protein SLS58_001545 [Diplodia intermedia]|uniref:Azaphilone pigments biosynthesis cluster protein L N-terminal domain-containing protein n=1 Tax=Diplodia intermedia TaxID=856260 RepID=A0ABR3U257_9PEZI
MEAVGGGASALAFIGIALKSTEAIYKTISGIKDAPDKVERLLSAVDDLRSILKQLSGLFAPPFAAQTFNDFDAAIQKCNEYLASLAKKLSLLHKIDGDGKWKSTWKRINAVLKKEDIQEMWTTVHHHVTVLGVYVGVLQSSSVARQTQSIFALEQAFQTNTNHVSSNTQTLEAQASLISSLDGRLRLLESHSSAAQQTAEQALGVLGQKIDAMPSLSENQFEVIKSMLDQLSIQQMERTVVEQCRASSQSSSTAPGSYQDSDSNAHSSSSASSTSGSTMAAHSFDILSSITRLCGLVDAKEKTVGSAEAVGIIEDLEVLLNTIQDAPASVAGEKRNMDDETAIARSDIKRAKGMLNSTYHVKVNNEKRILRARDPTKSVDKRTSKAVTTNDGTLLLRTRTRFENDASMDERILESLRPKLWREVLESTGHDPSQHKVLVDAFPGLRADANTSTTYLDEPMESSSKNIPDYVYTDSGDGLCFDEYSSDDAETEDSASGSSEASLDPDPSSSAEARTSEPSSPTAAARVQAPAGTFWDVIDYAVEEEGNPWA